MSNSKISKSSRAGKVGSKKGHRKLSVSKAEKAIREAHGQITIAADLAGVHYNTLRRVIEENVELQDVLFDVQEELKDIAESNLIELIKQGDCAAIKYYLSSKAKDRGYGSQVALTGANGGAVKVEMSIPDLKVMTDAQLKAYIRFQEAMQGDGGAA